MTKKDDDFPCTCVPLVVNKSDGTTTTKKDPAAGECMKHGAEDCEYSEPLHYHHDGCPACSSETLRRKREREILAYRRLRRLARRGIAMHMGGVEAAQETDGGALAKGVLRMLLTDDRDGALGMLTAVFMRTMTFDENGEMKPGKTEVTEEDLVDALKDLVKEPH